MADAAEERVAPNERGPDIWSGPYRRLTIGLVLTVSGAALETISVATIMPAAVRDLGGLPW